MKRDQTLRWRMLRGHYYLDLIEERTSTARSAYIGLIDGREAVRAPNQLGAGAGRLQVAGR